MLRAVRSQKPTAGREPTRPAPGPAGQLVTLRDVANVAEVHISTASRALDPEQYQRISPETVARIRAVADRLGYMPDLVASGLKRRRTGTVGVVVSDFDNPYTGPVIRGVSHVLEARGFVALVAETVEDVGRLDVIIRHLLSRRVDALITTAMHLDHAHVLDPVRRSRTPIVLAGRSLPSHGIPAVVHDDFNGGRLAADHLVQLGHRVIAQLLGPAQIDTFDRRRRGFESRLAESDVRHVTIRVHARAPTLEEGRRLMRLTLDADERPTAVFAQNDEMAVGAIEAAEEAGLRCPQDLSIVGYNDVRLSSHLSPPLTTVRVPTEEVGRAAGRIALRLIEEPAAEIDDVLLPTALVVRASTRRVDPA
jgi:LacI family transcriptional regulator